MRKLLLVLFVLCIMLSGCAKQEESGNANATWDAVEYKTIEEMNEAAGTNIVSAAVAGKTDESFIVISKKVAQYKFTCNDENWCIRASKDVDNDISGLHYDNITFEKDVEATYYNDEVYAHRFFNKDVQYVISLDVEGKDIATSHFDEVSSEFKTNITGIKSGYENEIVEDGDTVIYRIIMYNDNETTTTMETIYKFEGDKMVSIISNTIFDNEQAAKNYYDTLIENGKEDITLDGKIITSSMNDNLDFYIDMNKEQFVTQMKEALNQ